MKYKALMIDIDGTLVNSNGKIGTKTKENLRRLSEMGVNIILCTGRLFTTAYEVAKELEFVEYLVTSNGAFIYSLKDNKIIKKSDIDINNVLSINKLIDEEMLAIYNSDKDTFYNKNVKLQGKKIDIRDNSFFLKHNIQFIVIYSYERKKILDVISNLKDNDDISIQDVTESINVLTLEFKRVNYYCSITNRGPSKGEAVKFMTDFLDISFEEVVVIGDEINDISMFSLEGVYKVAMGNSIALIKDKANYITLDNNNDGVGEYARILIDKYEI